VVPKDGWDGAEGFDVRLLETFDDHPQGYAEQDDEGSCEEETVNDSRQGAPVIRHLSNFVLRLLTFSNLTQNITSNLVDPEGGSPKRYSGCCSRCCCIGLSRYIATATLAITSVFLEYLRQFLIDLHQIYRRSSVPKNTSPCIFSAS